MKVFLDINVILPRCFEAGGITEVSDFASEGRDYESRILTSAVRGEIELVSSVTALVTLRRKLMDPAVDSDPLDRDSAVQTAALFGALCTSTGGGYANKEDVQAHLGQVQNLVPAHLTGKNKGQIDHEDLTILAGCLANITDGETLVLLTNDTGLLNVAPYLAPSGVAICRPEPAVRGLAAA